MSPTHTHCITFINIKDCKGAPEPQHNLHLKNVVDGDADDEEEHHATEEGSNRNKKIGICRCENDTRRTSLAESFTGIYSLCFSRPELEWFNGLN